MFAVSGIELFFSPGLMIKDNTIGAKVQDTKILSVFGSIYFTLAAPSSNNYLEVIFVRIFESMRTTDAKSNFDAVDLINGGHTVFISITACVAAAVVGMFAYCEWDYLACIYQMVG